MTDIGQVYRDQFDHADASHRIDRSGWTPAQWVEDARTQMNHIDGSVLDLVNGHPMAMLKEIDRLNAVILSAWQVIDHDCAAYKILSPVVGSTPEGQTP